MRHRAFGNKESEDDSIQWGRERKRRTTMRMTRDRAPLFLRLAPLRLYRNFARVVVPWTCDAGSESICRSVLKGD